MQSICQNAGMEIAGCKGDARMRSHWRRCGARSGGKVTWWQGGASVMKSTGYACMANGAARAVKGVVVGGSGGILARLAGCDYGKPSMA